MNKVLITGATGFVGQHLVSALLPLPLPLQLRLAVRARQPNINDERREQIVVGDIDQNTQWQTALANVDCVVHLAGRVHIMNPTADDHRRFYETNVLGTERAALSAVKQGVKRFIFLSSIKVNGEGGFGRAYTPHDVPAPTDDYGKSKLQAEQKLLSIAQSSGMDVVIIRPPLVYGPGVRANFLKLLSWVDRGLPLPLGTVSNSRSLVSVWNLCDLIKNAIDMTTIGSGVYLVSDDADLATPLLMRKLASAMGRPSRLFSVPQSLLNLAGTMTGKSAEIARLCGSLTVDIADTKRQFQWAPPLTVDQSLERTVQWYLREVRKHGA